jgi:hypothetical protein
LSKCCKRLISIIETQKKQLKDKDDHIALFEEEKENQINSLVEELNASLKANQELTIKMKDNEIEYLRKYNQININAKINTKISNVTQYIINTYQNAPNIEVPNTIENMDKYITKNIDIGIANLVNDIYCKDKKPEERSIWCVDTSRNKFLLRMDNLWKVDLNGVQFCKDILFTVGNQYFNHMKDIKSNNKYNKDNIDEYPTELLQCMEMILRLKDMKKVPNEIKGLLVFDES